MIACKSEGTRCGAGKPADPRHLNGDCGRQGTHCAGGGIPLPYSSRPSAASRALDLLRRSHALDDRLHGLCRLPLPAGIASGPGVSVGNGARAFDHGAESRNALISRANERHPAPIFAGSVRHLVDFWWLGRVASRTRERQENVPSDKWDLRTRLAARLPAARSADDLPGHPAAFITARAPPASRIIRAWVRKIPRWLRCKTQLYRATVLGRGEIQ